MCYGISRFKSWSGLYEQKLLSAAEFFNCLIDEIKLRPLVMNIKIKGFFPICLQVNISWIRRQNKLSSVTLKFSIKIHNYVLLLIKMHALCYLRIVITVIKKKIV